MARDNFPLGVTRRHLSARLLAARSEAKLVVLAMRIR
jgi:hypothetical protein